MERRKDSKGRVLKEGESQRKDGRYQFRWTDRFGNRQIVYATDLKELREKETKIRKQIDFGINFSLTKSIAYDVVERYIKIREPSLKTLTVTQYYVMLGIIKKQALFNKRVCDITSSEAKEWAVQMHEDGYAFSTISNFKSVIGPAFDLACQDDYISKNPFNYDLDFVIQKYFPEKRIITKAQYLSLLEYIEMSRYDVHLDDIVILYETGLRIGEFCALTFDDIDFINDTISINKQIQLKGRTRFIQSPKSGNGNRIIPLSQTAKRHLGHLIGQRKRRGQEPVVDGVTGFISLTRDGQPKIGKNIQDEVRNIMKGYNKLHKDNPLPNVTPHTFRHCFCTNLVQAGLSPTAIQYLMGHSSVRTSLENYTHTDKDFAISEFRKTFTKN